MEISFKVKVLSVRVLVVSKIPEVHMKTILVFLHTEFLKLLTMFQE